MFFKKEEKPTHPREIKYSKMIIGFEVKFKQFNKPLIFTRIKQSGTMEDFNGEKIRSQFLQQLLKEKDLKKYVPDYVYIRKDILQFKNIEKIVVYFPQVM